jgi:hypothetical protein
MRQQEQESMKYAHNRDKKRATFSKTCTICALEWVCSQTISKEEVRLHIHLKKNHPCTFWNFYTHPLEMLCLTYKLQDFSIKIHKKHSRSWMTNDQRGLKTRLRCFD